LRKDSAAPALECMIERRIGRSQAISHIST
jgi:hypothetical protein